MSFKKFIIPALAVAFMSGSIAISHAQGNSSNPTQAPTAGAKGPAASSTENAPATTPVKGKKAAKKAKKSKMQ